MFFHYSVSGPAFQEKDRLASQKGIFFQWFLCDYEFNTVLWEEEGAK